MGPDELVGFQREHRDFQILDLAQRYVLGLRGRESHKKRTYAVIRSFFIHNRVPLPADRDFRVKCDLPRVVGSLAVEEVRRILDSCNECYRALFLCMFQGGMGLKEVVYWSKHGWTTLEEQLRRGDHPIRIDLPGRKMGLNGRPFYTFLGRDAVEALRAWIARQPRTETIFTNQFGGPVTSLQG